MTTERTAAFDFWGPKTLVGPQLVVGDPAPAFTLVAAGNTEVSSTAFAGKPLVISVVPSLDTDTCNRQTKRFNDAAATIGERATFVTVSADLPFAQERFCGAEAITAMQVLSDHRSMHFGDAYGTHIKELRFESRAAFVIDADGMICYAEYLPHPGLEPDYDAVLAALHTTLG